MLQKKKKKKHLISCRTHISFYNTANHTSIHENILMFSCEPFSPGAKVKNGDVAVTEGEDATMSCRITETDEIISQVTWQKRTRGNSVREDFLVIVAPQDVHHVNGLGERVRFIGDIAAQNGSIRVSNVSLRDEGNYTCIITVFPSGSFQTEIKLSVRVHPKVTITPEAPPVVGEGEQIMAACTAASGRPPASVTWVVDHLNSTFTIHSNETHHSDGTTTVRSYLIVVPTISMNEQEVQCVVNHTALKQEEVIPFRIQVHYPPHSVNIRHGTSREGPVFQCMADSSPSEGTKYTWSRYQMDFGRIISPSSCLGCLVVDWRPVLGVSPSPSGLTPCVAG
uniref:Ig-like domain-containing protein n=1 Tax=Scleropages formosus TaxID=113540 RepID=A0A8C9U456_SCLFO